MGLQLNLELCSHYIIQTSQLIQFRISLLSYVHSLHTGSAAFCPNVGIYLCVVNYNSYLFLKSLITLFLASVSLFKLLRENDLNITSFIYTKN